MENMTRRTFTAWIGGAMASAALPGCLNFARGKPYSVTALGDMHYDAFPPEKFHSNIIARWQKSGKRDEWRMREFNRNATMWQDICKNILKASAQSVRPDAAFVLQLGDLVQGDCESDALHTQMLTEATGLLEKTYLRLPILSLCGNHDIRDNAEKAYARYMLPFESRQLTSFLPRGVQQTTFGFRCGDDLWIVLDFNHGRRDVDIVRKLLADNPDVRYTFVTTHGPVLPMDLWHCRWFYLGNQKENALRRELRALFAKRHAIVLAGHVHSLEYKDWYGDGGRITEMVLNTCAGKSTPGYFPAVPEIVTTNPTDYGNWAKKPDEQALFEEYRPGLKTYFASHAVGHHILHVSDAGVRLDYFGHDALKPTKEFVLR